MHIWIDTAYGKRIKVEVEDSSKTIDLKIHGEPTRKLVLVLGPTPGSVADITIFLSTLGGKTFAHEVKKSTTVHEVKEMHAEKEGIPAEQMRLVFQGNKLEDSRTLADYNIQHHSQFHVVLRLCGC